MPCSYCKKNGHTRPTCPERKQDEAVWKLQQALLKVEKQEEQKQIREMARQTLLEIMELGYKQQTEIQERRKKAFTVTLGE